jgi:conjugal transfer pilus assembly protein TraI
VPTRQDSGRTHPPSGPTLPSAPHIYPFAAVDPGFDATPVAELLESHDDLIRRIRLCFGLDQEAFDRDVFSLVHAYAAYVHLLPATPDNYFKAPGGLLHLGLEVAFYALQGTDAHIFSGQATISTRRLIEPRWRLATFIGGLCCELHRALGSMIVATTAGHEWRGYLQPLSAWLADQQTERYFVRWRPKGVDALGLGLFALPYVVPAAMLQHLAEANASVVPHLLASVGGFPVYREPNVLDGLVRRSLALVVDRNLRASADRYGSPQFGSHLERHLVDAMRRLAATNPAWLPNREKSRVWLARDGLFIAWPQAVADVQQLLEADSMPGITKSADTILELLVSVGAVLPRDGSHPAWAIAPPGAKSPIDALRLATRELLWSSLDPLPAPLDTNLVAPAGSVAVAAPARTPPKGQLSLIDETPAAHNGPQPPVSAEAAAATPKPAIDPPSIALSAPMRLNPAVRAALADIVATMNPCTAEPAACTVAGGVFVPLDAFERRAVLPAVALRALADARMLVNAGSGPGSQTLSRDFAGKVTVGLVIDVRHVQGLDPACFVSPAGEGGA